VQQAVASQTSSSAQAAPVVAPVVQSSTPAVPTGGLLGAITQKAQQIKQNRSEGKPLTPKNSAVPAQTSTNNFIDAIQKKAAKKKQTRRMSQLELLEVKPEQPPPSGPGGIFDEMRQKADQMVKERDATKIEPTKQEIKPNVGGFAKFHEKLSKQSQYDHDEQKKTIEKRREENKAHREQNIVQNEIVKKQNDDGVLAKTSALTWTGSDDDDWDTC
jgi:hypothetical protein